MTDATQETTQEAPAVEAEEQPVGVKWYPYAPLKDFPTLQAYTGTPIEVTDGSTVPNATKWVPAGGGDHGLNYWDAELDCWRWEPDVTKASLDVLKSSALYSASNVLQAGEDELNAKYPATERNSWPQQISEAQGVLDGTTTAPVLLSALAAARNMDLKTLAQSIIDKSNAYNAAYATLLADYQKKRDAINAATKLSDLPALTLNELHTLVIH